MNPAFGGGLIGIFRRDYLLVEVELAGIRESSFFPHGFRAGEDFVIEDDGTLRGKKEMVDEASRVLTVRGGVGEGNFDELLGRLKLDIDPQAIRVDSGEDLVGGEQLL